jgi:hypothetical protein
MDKVELSQCLFIRIGQIHDPLLESNMSLNFLSQRCRGEASAGLRAAGATVGD